MELILQREAADGPMTRGRLAASGVFVAFTLEPSALDVPAGRYEVVTFNSPHFGRLVPRLLNVPGRDAIEMHGGNTVADSHGCVLVGAQRTEAGICRCDEAVTAIVRLVSLAAQRRERSFITILNSTEGKLTA